MKKITLILLFFSFTSFAQNWEPDYSTALTKSKEKNKPILLVFSGSDWCVPCIKLEKEIWDSTEFKDYANTELFLYRADFPRKKANKLSEDLTKKNKLLAEKFNKKGYFPLVILLDNNERILGTTSYKKLTPKAYISHLNSFLR